jgi:hypothetical protein
MCQDFGGRGIHVRIARYLALVALALAALPAAAAFAQYPEPLGVCTVTPNQASVSPNSVATFTVQTRTAAGAPAGGVSGTAAVGSGSGTVLTPTFTTNSAGQATIQVQTGSNPGNLTLNVTCGALQTTGVVSVSAPSVQPKPPDTGLGTASSDSLPIAWMLLAGMAFLAAAGAATATVTVRRK